jgi:hypothetical protein
VLVPFHTTTALTCPWCDGEARPGDGVQTCGRCGKRFTLTAGPAQTGTLLPPLPPNAPPWFLKWSIVVTYKFARLEPPGVCSGTLDPVVAVAPIDQVQIAYADIVSLAVWRKIAWVDVIVGLLVPAPIALLCLWGAIAAYKAPVAALIIGAFALLFGALAWFLIRRGAIIGHRQVRIVGRHGQMTIPFKGDLGFTTELFRRAGLVAPPIP